MSKHPFFALLCLLPSFLLQAAEPLVSFSFDGLKGNEYELTPSFSSPSLKSSALQRGKGLNYTILIRNCFGANGWTTSTEPTANDFYEFTVSPVSPVNLERLEFSDFVNPKGPTFFTVRSSLDNFTSDLCDPIPLLAGKPVNSRSIVLGEPFRKLSQEVTFRFIAWGAQSGGSGVWALGNPDQGSQLTLLGTTE